MKHDENERIIELKQKLRDSVRYYENEIKKEQDRIDGMYRVSYKRIFFMIGCVVVGVLMYELNKSLFPPESIWSWKYW